MQMPHNLPSPDAIVQGWQDLLATGAHVHLPQIAVHVGAPEAALIAARIGTGALRLEPDLGRLLTPIRDWHRVLLVASTGLGVLMPMDQITGMDLGADVLDLSGPALRARVDLAAVRDIYLFEEQDPRHGRSNTLQVFDAAGAPLLKVVIFHKSGFRAARDWAEAMRHPDQSRDWVPAAPPRPSFATPAAPAPEGWWLPFADKLAALTDQGRALRLTGRRPGLVMDWTGQLTGLRRDGAMLHLHELTLRAHLNLARAAEPAPGAAAQEIRVAGQAEPALSLTLEERA